ncbi:HEAT repeat domain-containing protein [Phototrophicus methaneseepsis]|uniref:HEAT repeat domain-containing protein n=1 Tax=Phototrophicus methaneseepsis TaxID=2710758 RepID=A0A7S8E602_9CHLR|nr:HEAT repeat domain-containing protein [Phototrophicus methaneseepsis]QPC80980.1 HEAT repeat domain-containing protein [Phototrophicus methaneseepsis]
MASNRQRIIDYHISRLSDKRTEVRLETIQELVLMNATEALEALHHVYETDIDETVKRAAQRAGRVLYQHKVANNSTNNS